MPIAMFNTEIFRAGRMIVYLFACFAICNVLLRQSRDLAAARFEEGREQYQRNVLGIGKESSDGGL